MSVKNRYATLFEPVRIGPVIAKNRFYQVPHCSGLGHLRPEADAAMRAMKAQGGWAVVSNQETEIHPSSDLSPYSEHRLWDERDIPALQLMTDLVHEHNALAAVQLVHNGLHAPNLQTRLAPLAPVDHAISSIYPKQARAMSKRDIREFREWHRGAARRARTAGFDIVYVYAGHGMTLPLHFLSPDINTRTDEYGGSLENRARLLRELLTDTLEAVGDRCAVALRLCVDELRGADGLQWQEEGRAVVELLADLPDLWDVNVSDWSNDSVTSRFQPDEGAQVEYMKFVKQVTSRPVVGVGRFTSPDLMQSLVRSRIMDFIGAARPSIADPFLPHKIESGRIEDIRECIGCNICVSSDKLGVPIRCTQNPTMGEEWRRNWHPEIIPAKVNEDLALVVGAGPAGLECALQLSRRGYRVTIVDARADAGGRVRMESTLPGLNAWQRVVDNRLYELRQKASVDIYLNSELDFADIQELEVRNVFVATGARWRTDGVGRSNRKVLTVPAAMNLLSPEQLLEGQRPGSGPVLIYDDDQAYLASSFAWQLADDGHEVIFVTPATMVSPWTEFTMEQHRIQAGLLHRNVRIVNSHVLTRVNSDSCEMTCNYSGQATTVRCQTVVMVTERVRQTRLFDQLQQYQDSHRIFNHLELIGDAAVPGLIADAIYHGHLAARNFESDQEQVCSQGFRREQPAPVFKTEVMA